jgi:hypothetical protein
MIRRIIAPGFVAARPATIWHSSTKHFRYKSMLVFTSGDRKMEGKSHEKAPNPMLGRRCGRSRRLLVRTSNARPDFGDASCDFVHHHQGRFCVWPGLPPRSSWKVLLAQQRGGDTARLDQPVSSRLSPRPGRSSLLAELTVSCTTRACPPGTDQMRKLSI